MILLHPYVPGHRPADQCPTWEALSQLDMLGIDEVRHVPCTGPSNYAWALRDLVDAGEDVIVVEQDIVPTQEQWTDLRWCRKSFCAADYLVEAGVLWSRIPGGFGLGLAKISADAYVQIVETPQVPLVHWRDLAGVMRERLGPPHLHAGPVQHNHQY